MESKNILEMTDINKSFSGVSVLKDINIKVGKAEIHGIVGENGAGKSTLMNVLGGVYQKDSGHMTIDGESYDPSGPKSAAENGVAFIHQELNLFSNLSIGENMFMEDYPKNRFNQIDFKKIYAEAEKSLSDYGLAINPRMTIDDLPMGTRQVVEIIKALRKNAKIIIFDEPTTSLSAPEKVKLFETIKQLKEKGMSVLFISHILEDVFELCDSITVIRDGSVIGTETASGLSQDQLVKMMVGRELSNVYPQIEKDIQSENVLEISDLHRGKEVQGVSFSLKKGEILGLYGIVGAGRTEMAKAVFGVDKIDHGNISINGESLGKLSPEACIDKGLAFVTEDRRHEGLLLSKPVVNNITLVKIKDILMRLGMINKSKVQSLSKDMVKSLNVKVSDMNSLPVGNLSGGNQQKVVFGKWVMNRPSVFILDEPTKGVDVGAKFEIYSIIGDMARDGSGILFISSEMEELIGICDRIMVMKNGKISGEVLKEDFDQEKIGTLAL